MKIKHLLFMFVAMPLLFAACEQKPAPDNIEPTYAPELTLTSEATMEFTAEGGEGTITYTAEMVEVTRTEESPAPEAECDAEWITIKTTDFEKCSFEVSANDGEARETTIVVKYVDKSFEVVVKQTAKANDEPEPVLTLTTEDTLSFTADGGTGAIGYTIENAIEGFDPTATCEAEWITDITIAETITFTVAANEGEAREATIVVSYGEQSFEVAVKQEAKPAEEPTTIEFTANHFDGEYYGDYYSPGIGNYYLHLSDNGFQESGYALPNSTYYRIDLYSDYFSGSEVEYLQLPYGTYTLDLNNTFAHGTFSAAYSKLLGSDAEGEFIVEKQFEAGELIVNEEGATLKVTIEGKEHTVTYKGATLVADKRSSTGEDVGGGEDIIPEDKLSTLTEDYTVVLDDHMLIYANYGDYYSTGLNNWTFAIWPNDYEGDHIQFDIMNQSSSEMFGEYSVGDENTAFSFFKGFIEDDGSGTVGYMSGSWYYTDDGVTMAPFVGGNLRISNAGGGNIRVDFTVTDDNGNTITGNWTGTPQALQ
ncbi:MAG: BACON domain-containing protein [Alistipes sp.]|nr:BACON domain-containing protein [Alistipes sp.]